MEEKLREYIYNKTDNLERFKKPQKHDKVLIVVDMQNGFVTKQNYIDLANRINNLISKNEYDKYIFTRFVNKENSFYETKLNWHELKDKQSQKICLNIPNNSIIFQKTGYGLTNEQIDYLKSLSVETVDVCGLQTDACVYAISFQLFDNGIYPNILKNYCETAPQRNEIAKEILSHQFGKLDERV